MQFGDDESSYVRPMTVMFVDMVGFSRVAETQDASTSFLHMKSILSSIANVVETHGGKVVKVLGDGLFCVFGDDGFAPDHAEQAVRCAIQIQQDALNRDLAANLGDSPVYPLRIGINTDRVCFGDLTGKGSEFTAIGHGVNFASRLEAACDGYSILVGPNTIANIGDINALDVEPRKRLLRVKHHDELIEAYECNPFEDRPDLLNQAIEAYRNFAGIHRVDKRWPVPANAHATVVTMAGTGELVNFSSGGLSCILPSYLARDVQLPIRIEFESDELNAKLANAGFDELFGIVRWGRPIGDRFIHGFSLNFRKAEKGDELVNELRHLLTDSAALKAS